MSADSPDFSSSVVVIPVAQLTVPAVDFPDWTDGYVDITGAITPGEDFPDWTKALVQPVIPVSDPTQLSGLVFWLNAKKVAQGDGTAVTAWADLSGNGNGFAQGAATNPPTLYTTTTAELINGHPAVRFTASSHTALNSATTPTYGSPFTLCMVAQAVTAGQTGYFAHVFGGGVDIYWLMNTGNLELANSSANNLTDGAVDTVAHSHLVIAASTGTVLQDGAQIIHGTSQAPGAGAGAMVLGALTTDGLNFPSSIRIGEVFLYNRALNATEQVEVDGYMRDGWGTP